MKAIEISSLSYSYRTTDLETPVLYDLSLEIHCGEMVAIQGPSGSGKSTLLYLLGALLKPQKGKIVVLGQNLAHLSSTELAYFRNQKIGFVFQHFHLLPKTTILQNIIIPTLYAKDDKSKKEEAQKKATLLATELGLEERLHYLPNTLSGGQQQRVAIARALIQDPDILLADEPTGNLDSKTSTQILELFRTLNRRLGKTIILITHDNEIASQCDRVIQIRDGTILTPHYIDYRDKDNAVKKNVEKVNLLAFDQHKIQGKRAREMFQAIHIIQSSASMALQNLFRNKIRTILTMVGISVGVAAVVSMITLGQFTKNKILAGYAELGVNTLLFYGIQNWEQKATDLVPTQFRFFDWKKDLVPLFTIFPGIKKMSPLLRSWEGSVYFGGRSITSDIRILGVNEQAMAISNKKLKLGRSLVKADVERKIPICVIGSEIAKRLFVNVYPLHQIIRIAQREHSFGCHVVGVLDFASSNNEWSKPNFEIILPYSYFQAAVGNYWATQILEVLVQVKLDSDFEKIGNGLRFFFEQKYGVSGKFRADSDSVLIAQMKKFLNLFTFLLGMIAAITLFVGGIGITNMMLVSVSERFREIGLRKAVGATDEWIRSQFLGEAIGICVIAGGIGLVLGVLAYHGAIWGATYFIKQLQFEWIFDPFALSISVIAIFLVGLVSGLFPAMKAEKLQVIEALRME